LYLQPEDGGSTGLQDMFPTIGEHSWLKIKCALQWMVECFPGKILVQLTPKINYIDTNGLVTSVVMSVVHFRTGTVVLQRLDQIHCLHDVAIMIPLARCFRDVFSCKWRQREMTQCSTKPFFFVLY
jgi:hypothetical protein